MITRKNLGDDVEVCELGCTVGEYVVNVQLVKDEGYITEVVLYFRSGKKLRVYHEQDCCEDVVLIDIVGGSLDSLVGQEIKCIKSVSKNFDERLVSSVKGYLNDSNTWTFVTISTFKDDITLRWHGNSNGYYSEEVDFAYYDEGNNRLL